MGFGVKVIKGAQEKASSIGIVEQQTCGIAPDVIVIDVAGEENKGVNTLFQLAQLKYQPDIVLRSEPDQEAHLTFYKAIAEDLGLNIVSILPTSRECSTEDTDMQC